MIGFDARILVYEYVENGNLDQWIHGDLGSSSPLNWENRMKIILGTAKGYMYIYHYHVWIMNYD